MCRVAGIQTGLGPSSNSLRISPGASTTTTTTTTTTTPKKAPAPSIVPGLTRELDELFLRAAQVSTRAVDVQKLEDTVQHAPIDEDTRTDVIAAARRAKDALANLSRFTGQEIASAYNTITDEARRKLEAAKRNAAAAIEGADAAGGETDAAIEGAPMRSKTKLPSRSMRRSRHRPISPTNFATSSKATSLRSSLTP